MSLNKPETLTRRAELDLSAWRLRPVHLLREIVSPNLAIPGFWA